MGREESRKQPAPDLTEKMIAAGCEVLTTWHIYNSTVDTERDVMIELWKVLFGDAELPQGESTIEGKNRPVDCNTR